MARGDCNITNICIPTRRIIYSAGFTPPAPPPPPECPFPEGSFSQGGEICDWGYRVRWDIDPVQVPSDQTNYLAYINLAELVSDLSPGDNALFWNDANRAEFRVTTSDGATEIPHYTSALNTVSETGYIWARVPFVSGSVTTSLFIYLANPLATEYAVGDPLGRNATFTGYAAFWDFEQDPAGAAPQLTDLTGNGRNGTSVNGPTRIAGNIGSAWDFDGFNEHVSFAWNGITGTAARTVTAWFKIPSQVGGNALYNLFRYGENGTAVNGSRYDVVLDRRIGLGNNGGIRLAINGGSHLWGAGFDDNAYHHMALTQGSAVQLKDVRGIIDGTLLAFSASTQAINTSDVDFAIAQNTALSGYIFWAGEISLAYLADSQLSDNRVITERNNQNSPSTFATFTNFLAST